MFYKIKSVNVLENMLLEVEFENGTCKIYNLRQLLKKRPEFARLEESSFIKNVVVDAGGYGVSWNEDIDISCNELWENGEVKNG